MMHHISFVRVRQPLRRFPQRKPTGIVILVIMQRDIPTHRFHQIVEHFLVVADSAPREPIMNATDLPDDTPDDARLLRHLAYCHLLGRLIRLGGALRQHPEIFSSAPDQHDLHPIHFPRRCGGGMYSCSGTTKQNTTRGKGAHRADSRHDSLYRLAPASLVPASADRRTRQFLAHTPALSVAARPPTPRLPDFSRGSPAGS